MVDRSLEQRLSAIAQSRIAAKRPEIEYSLEQIAAGNPLGAEQVPERRAHRIAAKAGVSARDAEAMSTMIGNAADAIDSARGSDGAADAAGDTARAIRGPGGPEAIQGPTIDFVGVEFLSRGRLAANAVGRVVLGSGAAEGTGFLVAPGLFLTNNHVIPDPAAAAAMRVEFDYEASHAGGEVPVTSFAFDADKCFVSDPIEGLDFTLIALGDCVRGEKLSDAFGYIPLSDAPDKHMLGEIANIIQHPLGRLKQIVVRANNLVARDETNQVLHYVADTEPGSSGSPVCNNEWQPIALHHWGGPSLELTDGNGRPLRSDINEGVRISAIVKMLRARAPELGGGPGNVLRALLTLWDQRPRPGPVAPEAVNAPALVRPGQPQVRADGSITWTFPIEISVRAPLIDAPRPSPPPAAPPASLPPKPALPGAERASTDFGDRGGYEPGFIPGFVVPMPSFAGVGYRLANVLGAVPGDNPNELRYHHFSIVMNADRRLAAVTACNIDGGRVVAVSREDKTANLNPTINDLGVESIGAEGFDDFQPDPRILATEQMAKPFYQGQNVPGFAQPKHPGPNATPEERRAFARATSERTARMFQKGHIIMRGDPAWGTASEALLAEADTFFYTNAAPQLGFFNQGSPANRPGAKGKLRWRAVETYVLRNAFTMRQRVCVFAGPVFDDAIDVEYRQGSMVPMKFWKLVIWAEAGELRSIALLADQQPVLDKLTQGVPEAFGDQAEFARVAEFLTTVAETEKLTKLDFGAAIRASDIRAGVTRRESVVDAETSALAGGRAKAPAAAPVPRRTRASSDKR